jgi:hypothetical protein
MEGAPPIPLFWRLAARLKSWETSKHLIVNLGLIEFIRMKSFGPSSLEESDLGAQSICQYG